MKRSLTQIAAIMLWVILLSPLCGYADNYVLQDADFTFMNPLTVGFTQIDNPGDLKTDNNASHLLTTKIEEVTGALPIKIHLSDNGQILNDGNWFTAFCVDIYQPISNTTYNKSVSLIPPSEVYGGLQAAWLYEKYYKDGDEAAIGGLQVAIWETIVDDYQNYDLTKGNFYVSGLNAAALEKANIFLSDLKTNFDPTGLNGMYSIMHDNTLQDLLVRYSPPGAGDPTDTPAGTPEPATMVLLGIGLIGVVAIRRKAEESK